MGIDARQMLTLPLPQRRLAITVSDAPPDRQTSPLNFMQLPGLCVSRQWVATKVRNRKEGAVSASGRSRARRFAWDCAHDLFLPESTRTLEGFGIALLFSRIAAAKFVLSNIKSTSTFDQTAG